MTPLVLSLLVGALSTVLSLPFAVAVSWMLERGRLPGRGLLHAAVLLPLALPPVVTGHLLLKLFSPRHGLLGALPVAFHWMGAVVAAAVVGFPLFVISITLAIKSIDPRLERVSRTLGRGPADTFLRVTLPLAWPGILAGAVLSFARGLGEFGATIVLAGRIPGETETIPLAIYAALDRPDGNPTGLVIASCGIAFASVVVVRLLDQHFRRRLELDA